MNQGLQMQDFTSELKFNYGDWRDLCEGNSMHSYFDDHEGTQFYLTPLNAQR